MSFVSILYDEGEAAAFEEKPKAEKIMRKPKIANNSPLPFKSILFDDSEAFNESLESPDLSENENIGENNKEISSKEIRKDKKELISFRQKSEEIELKKPKIKRKTSKKIISKPIPKSRNFVKENIAKAATFKKKSLIDEFISEPTPQLRSKTPELKEIKTPIPEIKEEIKIKPQPVSYNIEEPRPTLVKNLKVTNTDLLALVFQQFADLVVMQWEEAADALIDDLLVEEIEHLNGLESAPKQEYVVGEESELIMALESMLEDEIALRNKYL
ncbi:unnamed protein product [Blepharisma stoltei]|uniref:Uncharacterized protein n=1 Tax=Blepharisma stoltei TaxID=1481888 RepID=A0AAU9K9I2_9CILI|nr:unnamed protein product [Blepharisma stoltei]